MATKLVHSSEFIAHSLKGKKILITAGPTWVPIDIVRVISNIASAQTGILLAEGLIKRAAKVTLLLGPVEHRPLNSKIRLVRFKFFGELKDKLIKEIKSRKYDAVIHTAAVSDYRPLEPLRGKLKSDKSILNLRLRPTQKIINQIKKNDPALLAVGFKFEPNRGKEILVKEAKKLIHRSDLDLVVANTVKANRYLAYLVEKRKVSQPIFDKKILVDKLANIISERIWKK